MKICNLGIAFQKNMKHTGVFMSHSWAELNRILYFLSKTWLKIEFQDPRPVKKLLAKYETR